MATRAYQAGDPHPKTGTPLSAVQAATLTKQGAKFTVPDPAVQGIQTGINAWNTKPQTPNVKPTVEPPVSPSTGPLAAKDYNGKIITDSGFNVTPKNTVNTTVSEKLTADQLVDKALANDQTTNLSNYSWWNSADLETRQNAYKRLQDITGSASGLSQYVKNKGLTNLQNYSWWSSSPYKNDAWGMLNPTTTPKTESWTDVKTTDDLNKYINNLQASEWKNSVNNELTPPTKDSTTTDLTDPDNIEKNLGYFTDALKGNTEEPTFNAEKKLTDLQTQYGTTDIQTQIDDLDKQIADLQAASRLQTIDEEGKPVAMGVISGRITEEQRVAQEKMDYLNRQKTALTNSLQTKMGVINNIMSAAKTDYDNATTKYNDEYSKNLNTITLMRGLQQDALTKEEQVKDDARANWQILANSVTSGALDWSNATADQKLLASKLEMQAGLPAGTIDNLAKKSAGFELKTVLPGTDADGNATTTLILFNKQTGEYSTKKIETDYSSASSSKGSSNILSKSERVDETGTKVLDIVYGDGSKKSIPLGSTNSETQQSKSEQEFNKFRGEIIQKLYSTDPLNQISEDTAIKLVKARYPTMTDDMVSKFLAI